MADKEVNQTLSENSPTINSATYVSSSNRSTEQLIRGSCLSSNPFAIKAPTPLSNSGDGADEETKPIIAPSTLKLDDPSSPSEQPIMSSLTPKVVLRPSRLAVQTEKLDTSTNREKPVDKESENNITEHTPKESESMQSESKLLPKPPLFTAGISTSASTILSVVKETSNIDSPSSSTFQVPNTDETSSTGFVFGQNLHERALNYDSSDSDVMLSPAKAHDLTFEKAAQESDSKVEVEQVDEDKYKKSLSESAKEYESKQSKRKYDEISVITGEEEESNALQINCKLFEFNMANKSWLERGKGTLRLNDQMCDGVLRSRVVMRTQGNLRVVLNTKVWSGMTVQHPSEKKVQLSAIDSEGVRVFLVMARPKDADQLYSALDYRVSSLKSKSENSNGSANNSAMYDKVAFSGENSTSANAFSLNGTSAKRLRSSGSDELDSKFNAGDGETSSDSMKDSKDDSGSS